MTLVDEWESAPLVGVVHGDTIRTMDPRVRDLWIAGLRSGRYPQGYDRLRSSDDRYTAFGVLCDIATKLKKVAWDRLGDEWFIAPLEVPATGSHLPRPVREWAGIKGAHPAQDVPLWLGTGLHPMWRLSDIYRLPFNVIADLLADQY